MSRLYEMASRLQKAFDIPGPVKDAESCDVADMIMTLVAVADPGELLGDILLAMALQSKAPTRSFFSNLELLQEHIELGYDYWVHPGRAYGTERWWVGP